MFIERRAVPLVYMSVHDLKYLIVTARFQQFGENNPIIRMAIFIA
jgi:hypothetical protein